MATVKKSKTADAIVPANMNLEEIQEARVINLKQDYRGRPSKEAIIPAGLYLENDPRIMGLADYFLDKEFADELEFSDSEKLALMRDFGKKTKGKKEREGLRTHIEATQEAAEQVDAARAAGLLPPPETSLPRNPVRQRPTPVTPAPRAKPGAK